jgi:hypothetical protein
MTNPDNSGVSALRILMELAPTAAPSVPKELVERIYTIEERVQFDEERKSAAGRVRDAVQTLLDAESLRAKTDEVS